jgi:polyphosphate:AMP phosphotransferase
VLEAAERGQKVSKAEYEEIEPGLRVELLNAQFDLREAPFPTLVVVAGDDPIGCNEVLHVLHEWMDSRYLPIHAFRPEDVEADTRPAFWRYWRALPGRGEMGLYFGGMFNQVVIDRVLGELDDGGFERRLHRIERFERTHVAEGALVVKLYVHLPKKEHRRRAEKARGKKKAKADWRVDERARTVYERYDDILPVVEQLLLRTSSAEAPWHVVDGSDDRHRNLAVGRHLLSSLRARLDAPAPPPAPDAPAPAVASSRPSVLEALDLEARLDYDDYRERRRKAQARLSRAWSRASEEGRSAVLVFEGWDAAGKGGVIRRITQALDARDYRVVPIAAPTPEELAHHYLWRFWRQLPGPGRLLVFDRSWYGRVLVERVEGLTPTASWQRAYGEINDFEEQIAEHGMALLKFWLHIDPDEQMRRFQAREQTPYKKYKITDDDYRNRSRWDDYVGAVDEMVERTGTTLAPWHLVPANDKRWARVQVLETIGDAFEAWLDGAG